MALCWEELKSIGFGVSYVKINKSDDYVYNSLKFEYDLIREKKEVKLREVIQILESKFPDFPQHMKKYNPKTFVKSRELVENPPFESIVSGGEFYLRYKNGRGSAK